MLGGTHPSLCGRQCKHPAAELRAVSRPKPSLLDLVRQSLENGSEHFLR